MARRILPQGPSELPPAGDERREVLAERADALEEAAEAMSEDRGTISPEAFEIDNEIGQHFPSLERIPNPRVDSEYCWVQCSPQHYGRFVNAKKTQGWELVYAKDDDAPVDTAQVDNTCRIGDTLLMRIRKDRYIMLRRAQHQRQRDIEGSTESDLREMGDKYARFGVQVSVNDPQRIRQMAARGVAMKGVDQMIRDGNVPGMPRPGR